MIRPVSPEEVRPLRRRVLRSGQPDSESVYPGDDLPDTLHLGAYFGERLVGIASLYRENRVDGHPFGWRLRGMATEADVRGAGFGAAILRAAMEYVSASGGTELWCNARLTAVGFYLRGGLEVVSEEFDIVGFGPHVVMAGPVAVTTPAQEPPQARS